MTSKNQKYIKESELAKRWGFGSNAIAKWRREDNGNVPPHYCFNGRHIVYKLDEVREFEESKRS